MGDFNFPEIKWKDLEATGVDGEKFLEVTQDSYLFQHVFDPTRGGNMLDLVLTSKPAMVENLHVREHFSNSDQNLITLKLVCETVINYNERVKYPFHKGN